MQCLPTSVQIHRSLSVRRLYLENETRQTHSHYGTPLGSWRTADSVAAFRSSPDGCLDDRLFSGKHDLAVTPCLRDIDSPLESDTTKDQFGLTKRSGQLFIALAIFFTFYNFHTLFSNSADARF